MVAVVAARLYSKYVKFNDLLYTIGHFVHINFPKLPYWLFLLMEMDSLASVMYL